MYGRLLTVGVSVSCYGLSVDMYGRLLTVGVSDYPCRPSVEAAYACCCSTNIVMHSGTHSETQ